MLQNIYKDTYNSDKKGSNLPEEDIELFLIYHMNIYLLLTLYFYWIIVKLIK